MKKESNKIIKNYVNFCIVIVVFMSCRSFQIGEYKNDRSYDRLILNNDSTYTYNNFSDNFEYSSGIWRRSGNVIILNSFIKNKRIPLEISLNENTSSKEKIFIRINIITHNKNDNDYFCEAFTNNEILLFDPLDTLKPLLKKKTSIDILQLSNYIYKKNGSYTFSINQALDSVYFKVWKFPQSFNGKQTNDSLRTDVKGIMANLGDSITANIVLNDSLFGYKIFINKKLKYRNDCLLFENNQLEANRNNK